MGRDAHSHWSIPAFGYFNNEDHRLINSSGRSPALGRNGTESLVDSSLTGQKVALALPQIVAERGATSVDHVDGSEFQSKAMDNWAYQRGEQLDFIRPGKPVVVPPKKQD